MKSPEYVVHVKRTLNPALSKLECLLNFSLGLSNEMLEAIEARNIVKSHRQPLKEDVAQLMAELGDVAWYTGASAVTLFNLDVFPLESEAYAAPRLPRPLRTFDDLTKNVRLYSELVKKFVFHGKEPGLDAFISALREVWCALRDVCPVETARSLDIILIQNVNKLTERWPNGFTPGAGMTNTVRTAKLKLEDWTRSYPHVLNDLCTDGMRLPGDGS